VPPEIEYLNTGYALKLRIAIVFTVIRYLIINSLGENSNSVRVETMLDCDSPSYGLSDRCGEYVIGK
jgi:hypothetical protein